MQVINHLFEGSHQQREGMMIDGCFTNTGKNNTREQHSQKWIDESGKDPSNLSGRIGDADDNEGVLIRI